MKITKVKLPNKGEIHTYFIISDLHSYYINKTCYKLFIKTCKQVSKDQRRLIILGDFLDAEFLMKKHELFRDNLKDIYGMENHFCELAADEFLWGNNKLDHLEKFFDYIYFVEGNHDWRYKMFMDKYSPHEYKYNFDLKKQLNLKERGIPYVEYNNWLDIGDASFTHGMFHSATHLKKHYEACGGRSVFYGHLHKAEIKAFPKRGKTVKAHSLPAMCNLNPEYIKNTDNNWSNGFGQVNIKPNGGFNYYLYEMWDNDIVLPNGKLIE